MFLPFSSQISLMDAIERDRRSSPRPASRLEVQASRLEYQHMNQAFYTHPEIIRSRAEEIERSLALRRQINESKRSRPGTSVRVRRSIGQLLITAGERIRPELA
jgi:hypothetical protein